MIKFTNVTKAFPPPGGQHKMIVDDSTNTFPSNTTIGLLGRNGAGKSTLLQMIGGRTKHDTGKTERTGTVS